MVEVQWYDLVNLEDGCEIQDTARRAVSLHQLRKIAIHTARRLTTEKWIVWRPDNDSHQIATMEEVSVASSVNNCIVEISMCKGDPI